MALAGVALASTLRVSQARQSEATITNPDKGPHLSDNSSSWVRHPVYVPTSEVSPKLEPIDAKVGKDPRTEGVEEGEGD